MKIVIFAFALLIVAVSGVALYSHFALDSARMAQNKGNTIPLPPANIPGDGTPVALEGDIVCLPHKDTSGMHTMECAYGLKDDQGIYFALRDTDPEYKNISSAPMNVRVIVSGRFELKDESVYQSVGIIHVTKIEPAYAPRKMGLVGTYVCLPHKDTRGPQTDECAIGIKADNGLYYVLDSTAVQDRMAELGLAAGVRIQVEGTITPIELLSTNHWQKYPVAGIMSATSIVLL